MNLNDFEKDNQEAVDLHYKIHSLEEKLAESEKMRSQNQDAAVTNLGTALELNQRLSEALEVIRFYGSPQSWSYPGNDFHDFQIAKEDISECAWSAKSGKLMRGRKAGKRAREFMKKHGVEDETI